MGACKPHHSCGMTLPMCPVRPGREEAPLVSKIVESPLASIECLIVSSQITFNWPQNYTINNLTNDGLKYLKIFTLVTSCWWYRVDEYPLIVHLIILVCIIYP